MPTPNDVGVNRLEPHISNTLTLAAVLGCSEKPPMYSAAGGVPVKLAQKSTDQRHGWFASKATGLWARASAAPPPLTPATNLLPPPGCAGMPSTLLAYEYAFQSSDPATGGTKKPSWPARGIPAAEAANDSKFVS